MIRLGLIGDNIWESSAPDLHRLAGGLAGLDVTYGRFVPPALGVDFEAAFRRAQSLGYRGLNVTLPYKERAPALVQIDDPLVAALGAINTIVFAEDGPRGFNTDYSGFIQAWRQEMGAASPGAVALIGAGGVGKAVGFALLALEAATIQVFDQDSDKAAAFAAALKAARPELDVTAALTVEAAVENADGVLNCTPAGMAPYGGTAVDKTLLQGRQWVFDAVYTPRETPFLKDAAARGLKTISGYELFFWQGVDAFERFAGRKIDPAALRAALSRG